MSVGRAGWPAQFRNPVLSGSHPDPSICRVGDDFYLATSTMEYFPGIPIHHSRDLVNWRLIGHAYHRPEQLSLDGVAASRGLFAPTLRHHAGIYYVVCTLVDRPDGNFVVTARDPAGPWSDPAWIAGAPGFDPSLLFDDGRVWICGSWEQDPIERPGHTVVWLQELEMAGMRLTGERHLLWEGALRDARWLEAPHIYRVGEYYYLLAAEGGTSYEHAVVVARSREVTGPYEASPRNPILSARHLGAGADIVGPGHADLVQTPDGEWWAVLLAMRPQEHRSWNTGRETFLTPVGWEDGWPVMNPGRGRVELHGRRPSLPDAPWPSEPHVDAFDTAELAPVWTFLRTPRERWWSLTERPGHLRLRLRPPTLADRANPSFLAVRQRHPWFAAYLTLDFTPSAENESAGLALFHSDDHHVLLEVSGAGRRVARVVCRSSGVETVEAQTAIPDGVIGLGVESRDGWYVLRTRDERGAWVDLGRVDARVLGTPAAGGFSGVMVGVYATAHGQHSETVADIDWFEYHGIEA